MKLVKIYPLFFVIILLSIFSCEDENDVFSDIKIGKEASSLQDVLVNNGSERSILLSGGNGKYTVNVADSKIASVKISNDTLKIKGLFEGETFATLFSHDKKAKLNIRVAPVEVSISQNYIRLYPQAESKVISLSGGDIVKLEVDDPENILKVKWNGNTGILEILAFYEGEATITAKTPNQPNKTLKIKVQSEGEVKNIGIYDITSRYVYPVLTPTMVVKRKNVGVWLASSTNPYGFVNTIGKRISLKFSPIKKPMKGEYINVNVEMQPYLNEYKGLKNGVNRLLVEEVRENTIVLKNRESKIVLPFEK